MSDGRDPRDGWVGDDPVAERLATYLATGSDGRDDAVAVEAVGLDARQRAEVDAGIDVLRAVRAELADGAIWDQPSAGLEDAVVAAIVGASTGSGLDTVVVIPDVARPATDAPAPADAHPLDPVDPVAVPRLTALEDRLERSERTQHRLRAVAVAASFVAVLAALVAIVSVVGSDGEVAVPPAGPSSTVVTTVPTTEPVTTTVPAPTTTAPTFDDSRELVAGPMVPDAIGQVFFKDTSSGLRIYLDAENLPGCEQGTVYEAWVKTTKGMDVSVGTFHSGGHVTLWAGVDLPDVRAFWVSIQDEGDHAPSDRRVVSASLTNPPAGTTMVPAPTTSAPS